MKDRGKRLSKLDLEILRITQKDCKKPLEKIASELKQPSSTIYYRIKQMEKNGVIRGYYTDINPVKLGKKFWGVILIRAKYRPHYHEVVGRKLSGIKSVQRVYFVWGDWDFIVIASAEDNDGFLKMMNQIINMKEIERTSTQVVSAIIKDSPTIDI